MIKTRFSPSPTGMLHLGNVRAALFSALLAKKSNGRFILRIEDTDATRNEMKFAEVLQEDLQWLGIQWQEGPGVEGPSGPYWQSQRGDIYAKYYQTLIDIKLAFPCFCTEQELALNRKLQLSRGQAPRYPGTCYKLTEEEVAAKIAAGKKPALRFHVPAKKNVDFVDTVKGPQHFNSDDIGDFIIRRADGTSSFMFCNAIDDALMGVTHVLRGEDHLSNTPRQLMILEALDLKAASYGHLSLIMGADGTPLSKRHGSFSLHDLRDEGYLPQAVLNYLARLSHTYDELGLMTMADLAANFDTERLSRASARFDSNQLLHWQKESVMALSPAEVWAWLGDDIKNSVPTEHHDLFIDAVRPNITFPSEALAWISILFNATLEYTPENLTVLEEAGEDYFTALKDLAATHATNLPAILDGLKTQLKIAGKKLFMPLRVALTAQQSGPELQQIVNLLGKDKIISRAEHALQILREKHVKNL
jgi:glutamyl-tRNA synthetase